MYHDTTEGGLSYYFKLLSFLDQKILNISLVKIEIDNQVNADIWDFFLPSIKSYYSKRSRNLNGVIEIDGKMKENCI